MDSLPVTLIVKAPNQQIEDQKIKCETSWTINKLKEHLAEVYPSKPPRHEQKLIYSGQLLNDSLVLKDILRQYDGQDTHTVHLVCTPKLTQNTNSKPPTLRTESTSARSNNSNMNNPTSNTNSATASNGSPESASRNIPSQNSANTSRIPSAYSTNPLPNNGFQWMNMNGQATQMDFSNLNQYQLQMAMMQQAYMQYMAQYMQLASGQIPTIPPTFSHANTSNNTVNGQPNPGEAPPQGAAQPNVAAPPRPENDERDWLDVFYMLSRAMVLFSVVYFYSSPIRFIFVLFLGIALYLYQTGFFRNININNNNINQTPNGQQDEEQAPTRFMVAWTFIATFFASLIPEIPNINA